MYGPPCEQDVLQPWIMGCWYSSVPSLYTLVVPGRVLQKESCGMETENGNICGEPFRTRQGKPGQWSLSPITVLPTQCLFLQRAGTISPSFIASVLDSEPSLSADYDADLKFTANSMYAASADTVRTDWNHGKHWSHIHYIQIRLSHQFHTSSWLWCTIQSHSRRPGTRLLGWLELKDFQRSMIEPHCHTVCMDYHIP